MVEGGVGAYRSGWWFRLKMPRVNRIFVLEKDLKSDALTNLTMN